MGKSLLLLEITNLPKFKRGFATHFPQVKSAHRTELAARGLGYRTYAALREALKDRPLVFEQIHVERAIQFADQIGVEVDPHELRQVFIKLLYRHGMNVD